MKYIFNFEQFVINEGTSNYWPGYSDDGTFDSLTVIREKTDKVFNKELEKYLKDYLKVKDESELLWNKWHFSNIVLTALCDRVAIKMSIIDKVVEYYKELEKDANIKIMFAPFESDSTKSDAYFKESMVLINKKLKQALEETGRLKKSLKKNDVDVDNDFYYPDFLNSPDDLKLKEFIDKKFEK